MLILPLILIHVHILILIHILTFTQLIILFHTNLFNYLSIPRSNGLTSVSLGEVIEAIKEIASEGNSIYTESNQVVFIRA